MNFIKKIGGLFADHTIKAFVGAIVLAVTGLGFTFWKNLTLEICQSVWLFLSSSHSINNSFAILVYALALMGFVFFVFRLLPQKNTELNYKQYTQDIFDGVYWRWRWEGEKIYMDPPLCPKCFFKLQIPEFHFMKGGYHLGCPNCKNLIPTEYEHADRIMRFYANKVQQLVRTGTYKDRIREITASDMPQP